MRKPMMQAIFLLLALPVLTLTAVAEEETGGLRVTIPGEGSCTVTLYYVAEQVGEDYRITEAFGGGMVRGEDALSPHLANLLLSLRGEAGDAQRTDGENSVEYPYLPRGLYLVAQSEAESGASAIVPFLMPIPFQGQWYVHAYPEPQRLILESPKTGDHPGPILGAIGMVASSLGLSICAARRRKR